MIKKVLPFILVLVFIFTPLMFIEAKGLIPDCNITGKLNSASDNYAVPCDFNQLMTLINTVINFLLIKMATPLFALIIIYVGWLYLSDMGSVENVSKAKKIFKNAIIGYIIALAAWIIVKTILSGLGYTGPLYLG